MKPQYILYLLLLLPLTQACKSNKPTASDYTATAVSRMKNMNLTATTRAKRLFEEIPSASGVAHVQNAFYVVGDDSPFLYQLNEEYQLVQRHALFDSSGVVNGRIPKAAKPDLESMTHFSYGRDELLLLLGSGASEARNKAYLVNLTDEMAVQELDLSRFYTFLKRVLRIENEGVLNIEGLAMDDVYTYLLQRPAGAGSNILIRMDTDDFKQFVLSKGDIPAAAVYYFKLPVLGQSPAGFSGAYTLDDKLFFTASVEDTPNAIDDGEVLGSFIGVIDLNALPYATDEVNPLEVPATKLQNPDGSAYIGKAESLVVNRLEEGQYRVVVLSDDDAGHSELLEVQLGVTEQL